jgi:hypothetical protein
MKNERFWKEHPGLVWSNPEAGDEFFCAPPDNLATFTQAELVPDCAIPL